MNTENLKEIQLYEIEVGTVIRIHTDYDQVIETPVKSKKWGWGELVVRPSLESDAPSFEIRVTYKVYLVRQYIEEPEHIGAVVEFYNSVAGHGMQIVKADDRNWRWVKGSNASYTWEYIQRSGTDIKVLHEGYNPDMIPLPESWGDLDDVPEVITRLIDGDEDSIRRAPGTPSKWQWQGIDGEWHPYEYRSFGPYRIDPDYPLTNEGQE